MLPRRLLPELEQRLHEVPAVTLLGPRQVGKTTLALEIGSSYDALYLDLESERDRAKLSEPELYLSGQLDRLVIIDEIHRSPGLFPVLRGLIDQARRSGRRSGVYLLLGSAALDLLRQTGETLAGRVSYLELHPFDVLEIAPSDDRDRLWLRGGFPESYLAASDGRSLRWREDFIRSYLEQDIPQFGPRIPAERLRRFWTMLAHQQGGILNVAQLARNVGVDAKTAANDIDLLVDLLLVRRLPAWHANVSKRLVRSPKVYVRDSGLLHQLLGIDDEVTLERHPKVGASWDGFAIEQVIARVDHDEACFWGTHQGAEIDLVLRRGDRLVGIECKRVDAPRMTRSMHIARSDLRLHRLTVTYPGATRYTLADDVEAVPLSMLAGDWDPFEPSVA